MDRIGILKASMFRGHATPNDDVLACTASPSGEKENYQSVDREGKIRITEQAQRIFDEVKSRAQEVGRFWSVLSTYHSYKTVLVNLQFILSSTDITSFQFSLFKTPMVPENWNYTVLPMN